MAIPVMSSTINPPDVRAIISPLLSALPAAAMSSKPAPSTLQLLSPILRQRVQLLSAGNNEPWLPLLNYQSDAASKLSQIARSGLLEPHPVSGEIEVDWDSNSDVLLRFMRIDHETLQAMVVLSAFNLFFRLVYCTGDKDGGSDGWRVGEVGVPDLADAPRQDRMAFNMTLIFDGSSTLAEAESVSKATASQYGPGAVPNSASRPLYDPKAAEDQDDDDEDDDEDDDDGYWDRYDATPARTPAVKRSPAPQSMQRPAQPATYRAESAEDAYFAQYDSVQPALDNHDPDGEAAAQDIQPPTLGPARQISSGESHHNNTSTPPDRTSQDLHGWTLASPPPRSRSSSQHSSHAEDEQRTEAGLLHPRPASSASSNGSASVAKLEEAAAKHGQSEFGVKQHVSRSIRSLFLLSRASGIDREEFEQLVRTELDVLGMVEDDI